MKQERLLKVIRSQHISEKATIITEKKNEYVFHVIDTATKPEVKDAVELVFGTKVANVRIMNVRTKKKQFKGIEGTRKSWKKAYVTLQADQKLEMLNVQ